jgi:Type I restriction-modification system methyltransferase subunit
MARAKKSDTLTLEKVLWNCRVALRGIGSTEKNRNAVISLVFLKFASDKFAVRRLDIVTEHGENFPFLDNVAFYAAENVFYLKETARWSYIVEHAAQNDIAVVIDRAFADIEDDNETLRSALPVNLFATLGLEKSRIKNLIDNVNKLDEKSFHEEDLIGRVYEYFCKLTLRLGRKRTANFTRPLV